jgi:hypothetical protein
MTKQQQITLLLFELMANGMEYLVDGLERGECKLIWKVKIRILNCEGEDEW